MLLFTSCYTHYKWLISCTYKLKSIYSNFVPTRQFTDYKRQIPLLQHICSFHHSVWEKEKQLGVGRSWYQDRGAIGERKRWIFKRIPFKNNWRHADRNARYGGHFSGWGETQPHCPGSTNQHICCSYSPSEPARSVSECWVLCTQP